MNRNDYSISAEYSVKKVTNLTEFEKLRTPWDNLVDKQGEYTPFFCFDWFRIWLEHFLKDDKLLILLLYKGSELVTIAPFLIKEEKFKGINVKKIELAGNVYSPIRYFLFKEMGNGERENTLSYIFEFFSKFHRQWDIIDLSPIPEENGNFIALKNAVLKSSFKNAEIFCFGNWYLDGISYQSDKYFSNLSKKERKNIRQDRNRMEKAGKVVFKMIKNSHEVETYMKTYFEIYEKSWKKRERAGPEFYLDLTRCFAEKDWLRLGFVFLSGVPTAVGFAFVCDGLAYFEKVAYDEDYQNLGAGSVWFMEMVKYVIDVDKVRGIDFMRGDDPYKKHWVPQRRERKGILVFNNNLKGNYLSILVQYILPTFNRNKHLRKIKELVSNKVFKIRAA